MSYLAIWTPDKVTQLINQLVQTGSQVPVTDIVRSLMPGCAPDQLTRLVVQGMELVGDVARVGTQPGTASRAVEALSAAAESVPQAGQQLISIVRQGGQQAPAALEAVRQLLQQVRATDPAYAESLLEQLAAVARAGREGAQQLLTEIEENPGLYGALSSLAGGLLRSLAGLVAGVTVQGVLITAGGLAALAGLTYLVSGWLGSHPSGTLATAGPKGDPARVAIEGSQQPANPPSGTVPSGVVSLDVPSTITIRHRADLVWPLTLNFAKREEGGAIRYEGKGFDGTQAKGTLILLQDGTFSLTVYIPTKSSEAWYYKGKRSGNSAEGSYGAPPGFGLPNTFKAEW
jgi:hypothetical protein